MRTFALFLFVVVFCAGMGIEECDAHKRQPPKAPVQKKKEDANFFSVLRGFFNRVPPQNRKADEFGLEQIWDAHELEHFIKERKLAWIPSEGAGYRVALKDEPNSHQHARAWVRQFITDFGGLYHRKIGERIGRHLKISSLTRPVAYQQEHIVGNRRSTADCEREDRCSLHTRGIAFDISKLGVGREEERWIRSMLARIHRAGIGVDVTEERKLNHFHIIVFPEYQGLPTSFGK